MWRRHPDYPVCTALLLRVILSIILAKHSSPQELPSRETDHAFGINTHIQRNIFYDTNAIPEGLEVSPYLFVNTTKKFFYLLETSVPRLDITVSPCASPIVWQVTHKPSKKTETLFEFGNEVENTVVGFNPVVNTKDILYTLRGEITETLRLDAPKPGIYTIDITSLKTDSYVNIFVTQLPEIDRFPELPRDHRVKEISKSKKSFTVEWDPSPDERHFGENIEYCIVVNRKRNFKTLCSVLSHLNGDPKPTLPPDNGFGFTQDMYKRRLLKQNARPIKSEKKGSIFYKCIGRNTKATLEKVKTRKGYYVDVFVKNSLSDGRYRSRRYNGTFIKTKRKSVYPKLKNGRTRTAKFSKKTKKITYSFYNKATKDVYLAISSCSGKTRIEVSGANGTVLNERVSGTKVLTVKDVPAGLYTVALSRKPSRRKSHVHISATARKNNLLIPILPDDRTVKTFDNLSTCSSITVALKGTSTKQNYCLYKTELSKNSTAVSKQLSECGAYSRVKNGAQRIMCKKFKYSQDNAVLAVTVTNLNPDTVYIFDVFVNRGKYFTFSYNSVRTKTSPTCYLPT